MLTLSWDTLAQQSVDAGLVGAGSRSPAGCCDADVLPIVLGGPSLVLDVGRCQRLVTPEIRAALEHRDQGCVFPGCDKPPQACHAHHILPWWAGGTTAVWNLVLLCPHHNGIIEPAHPTGDGPPPSPDDRWQVRLRTTDGAPEILPPRRVDPHQQPRQHTHFLTRQRQ
ncbi:MAG: HNH endonuclease [Actinobacteria bacterium]|nr:HNH endonuclease [Actinomycetota bacterium]